MKITPIFLSERFSKAEAFELGEYMGMDASSVVKKLIGENRLDLANSVILRALLPDDLTTYKRHIAGEVVKSWSSVGEQAKEREGRMQLRVQVGLELMNSGAGGGFFARLFNRWMR